MNYTKGQFWVNKSWSAPVRQHFHEALYFFRVTVPSFKAKTLQESINRLKEEERTRGLSAVVVFGPYDLIFRVWLHSNSVQAFAQQLYLRLGLDRTPDYFHVHYYGERPTPEEQELLEVIDDWQIVHRVQQGEAPEVFDRLVKQKLVHVHQRSHPETIKFLATLGEGASQVRDSKLDQVRIKIDSRLTDSKGIFMNCQIYSGQGFCPILIEAEVAVQHFYNIGVLTMYLLDEFGPDGLHCQSYIFVNPDPFVSGLELVDDRTLLERRSKDVVVSRFAPQALEELTQESEWIIQFLTSKKQALMRLDGKDEVDADLRELIKNVMQAVSTRNLHLSITHLLSYVAKVEGDLRARVDILLREVQHERVALFKQLSIPLEKHLSFGDIIKLFDHFLKVSGNSGENFQKELAPLVVLRNTTAHNAYDANEWREALEIVIKARGALAKLYRAVPRGESTE